jgi:hypothetical protein
MEGTGVRGQPCGQFRTVPVVQPKLIVFARNRAVALCGHRHSTRDLIAGTRLAYELLGRKLRSFVRSLYPSATKGFEEMNHRLHVCKRGLSQLVLGRE